MLRDSPATTNMCDASLDAHEAAAAGVAVVAGVATGPALEAAEVAARSTGLRPITSTACSVARR